MKRLPVRLWHRLSHFWDKLLHFCEASARAARQRLVTWLRPPQALFAMHRTARAARPKKRPVVHGVLATPNNASLPSTFSVDLSWDGSFVATTTFSTTGFAKGADLIFAVPVSNFSGATGRHTWGVRAYVSGTFDTGTITGHTFVVVNNSGPFGAGWSFSGAERLVQIDAGGGLPEGKLRVYGDGDWRFYEKSGSTYNSPAGDNGTLSLSGSTYTYETPAGDKYEFESTNGRLVRWLSADGNAQITYAYDGGGKLTGMTSIDGGLATFNYDVNNRVETVQAPGPRTWTLTYGSGDLTLVTDPEAGLHSFTYDSGHRLTDEAYGLLANGWDYNAVNGALATLTWGDGSPAYNSILVPAVVQGLEDVTGLVRDPATATLTDALDRTTAWELDAAGRPTKQFAADGGVWQWTRNGDGYVTAATDPLQRTTTYTRDGDGYVTVETLPDNNTREYAYQAAFHALTRFEDERGAVTSYSYYNGTPHLKTVENALNQLTTYTYTGSGLLESVETPPIIADAGTQRVLITNTYDSSTRRLTQTDTSGGVRTAYTYDDNGNMRTTTVQPVTTESGDPDPRTTTSTYDKLGRLQEQRDPLNQLASWSYDTSGLPTGSTDTAGRRAVTSYDTDGRGLAVSVRESTGT
jgi:YD repeat-containing protein